MKLRSLAVNGSTLVAVVVAVAVVGSTFLGQPVLLSFVETGSMQPALDPGDGFVAIPKQVAGPVEQGDVVVFEAEEIHDGGLVTHRVVGETDRGYITKGDANAFTDQSGSEPPVKDVQIVAVALQVGGQTVALPYLGAFVEGVQGVLGSVQRTLAITFGLPSLLGVQGLAYLFFALCLAWYVVGEWRDRGTRSRDRDRVRETGTNARLVVAVFALLLVVAATASMVGPAGTQKYGIVSAEFDSPGPRVIPMGESETAPYPTGNGGVLPVVVFLEPASEGIDVQPRELRIERRSAVNATVTLTAPPETGYYRRFLVEHRYLALLPQPTIRALYQVHPWLPILAIDALIGIPFYWLGVRLVGTGRIRDRSRSGPSSISRLVRRYT